MDKKVAYEVEIDGVIYGFEDGISAQIWIAEWKKKTGLEFSGEFRSLKPEHRQPRSRRPRLSA